MIGSLIKTINRVLAPIRLKVIRSHPGKLSGVNLFPDLRVLINSDSPVCLDVGANTGQTIDDLLATLKSPWIYSFEPSSSVFKVLASRDYGKKVYLFNHALGSENQEREFINYKSSTLSSFLQLDSNKKNRFRDIEEENREVVQIKTIDTFLSQHHIEKVDLLKVDTQGFDLDVLLGAEKAFKAGIINYVLIELNFVEMYEEQAAARDIIYLLEDNGLFLIDYYEKVRQGNTVGWCAALFGKR